MTHARTRTSRRWLLNAAGISLLVVVTSFGSAWAATRINGSRLVPRSVAGSKLKLDAATGREVKESSLARVPNAQNAVHANTATSATSATTADFGLNVNGTLRHFEIVDVIGGLSGTIVHVNPAFELKVQCDDPASTTQLTIHNDSATTALDLKSSVGGTSGRHLVAANTTYTIPGSAAGVDGAAAYRLEFPSYSVTGFIGNAPAPTNTCTGTADLFTH